jgi:HTH-type transcriptional regulator, competence development regulator
MDLALTAFGFLLQRLREERQDSLRDVAKLADIDHAYYYRLETGSKESPSDEVLSRIIRALKAGEREAEMLRYLAKHPETDPGLVEYVLKDKTVAFEEFSSAAGAAFRGNVRPDYAKLIERVRRFLSMEE